MPEAIIAKTYLGRSVARVDAAPKTQGDPVYLTDRTFPNPCYGRVLRSKYPHARILKIDTAKAKALEGVICVLTGADVPGLNGFGIVIPDQPVLCQDKVRMTGDAVALVAAETPEIAAAALNLIEVDYEPLPLVDDPLAAMMPGATLVHDTGNIHLRTVIQRGDTKAAFQQAAVIADHLYLTPRQAHIFLETEGGWGQLLDDGTLLIHCAAQAAFRDRLQLARILGWEPERIREISSPAGGAFGGKDELTVQHYLALLALHTNHRPVRLHLSREESMIAGVKRHPFLIHMRTAAAADGTFLANEVTVVADTGAYATLGGPVVNLSLEQAGGPYRFDHVDLAGYCVYTNNGISGAMRGFGVPQIVTALEGNIDEIALKLGRDPLELRRQNALVQGERSAIGNPMLRPVGTQACLDALEQSALWQGQMLRKAAPDPWKRRGVGMALCMQGLGLGKNLPDFGAAVIELLADGRFKVGISIQEIGTGNQTAYAQFAAEALGCDIADIEVIQGDTGYSPDSGTVTATRSVYTGGKAIQLAAESMKAILAESGGIEAARREGRTLKVQSRFDWPEAPEAIPGAFGLPHHIYGYGAQAALVEVDTLTGEVEVLEVASVVDAGKAINPQGIEGQSEGGVVQGLGFALMEDTVIVDGIHKNTGLSTYIIPSAQDAPHVDTLIVEVPDDTGPSGAKGMGEVPIVPAPAAIVNAIRDALDVTITRTPATPERIWEAMERKRQNLGPVEDTPRLRERLQAAKVAGLAARLHQTSGEEYAQPTDEEHARPQDEGSARPQDEAE
ncbi:MAG TPA: xanthine dehydrogenase family protein molybdopterin-binding subunit [Symbiobacteriaceae bacterium]